MRVCVCVCVFVCVCVCVCVVCACVCEGQSERESERESERARERASGREMLERLSDESESQGQNQKRRGREREGGEREKEGKSQSERKRDLADNTVCDCVAFRPVSRMLSLFLCECVRACVRTISRSCGRSDRQIYWYSLTRQGFEESRKTVHTHRPPAISLNQPALLVSLHCATANAFDEDLGTDLIGALAHEGGALAPSIVIRRASKLHTHGANNALVVSRLRGQLCATRMTECA